MEQKTKVQAKEGEQDLIVTREFDLPVTLLFKAHVEPSILQQWMTTKNSATKALKFDCEKDGSYILETTGPDGSLQMRAGGVFHELIPDKKIIRTYEMENTPFGVQLEIYEFEPLSNETSKLNLHVIYQSTAQRDQLLQMPFTQAINLAHNRIQEIVEKLK